MVIRDLTLRSAASFGSFHLIRLLFDEYMFYLVEQKIAEVFEQSPVSVIGRDTLNSSKFNCKQTADISRQILILTTFYISGSEAGGSTEPPRGAKQLRLNGDMVIWPALHKT